MTPPSPPLPCSTPSSRLATLPLAPSVTGPSTTSQALPSPQEGRETGSGGISLLYHTDCPIAILPTHSLSIDPTPNPNIPASSALVCAIVRPRHRAPFLLAVVYLQPQRAKDASYISLILDHIETASESHPTLPLLVVGDFNCHHTDWFCPMAIRTPSASISSAARHLASWIEDSGLDLANPPGMFTREGAWPSQL